MGVLFFVCFIVVFGIFPMLLLLLLLVLLGYVVGCLFVVCYGEGVCVCVCVVCVIISCGVAWGLFLRLDAHHKKTIIPLSFFFSLSFPLCRGSSPT